MQTHVRLSVPRLAFDPGPSKPIAWSLPRFAKHLRELDLFEGLAPEALEPLEKASQTRVVEKGGFVFLPGDSPANVYFLLSGSVKISRLTEEGKEFILELVAPGDCFGESGVFDPSPHETVAETLERSVLLSVPSSKLRQLLTTNPTVLMRLTEHLGDRQKQLEKRLVDAAHKNARQRIADLLVRLGRSYGVRDRRGTLLRIKLSQTALGNLLGVSREIVNHAVSDLRRRGVIEVAHGRVIIQNAEALADAAA